MQRCQLCVAAQSEEKREKETDIHKARRMESIQGHGALMVRASAASGEVRTLAGLWKAKA